MKILYVEDDKEDRYLFEDALKVINHRIEFESATGREEALFKLKTQHPPALIFLDLCLPLRGGIDCLKAIKSNPQLDEIPVIIYSASSDEQDIIECMDLGAAQYLIKPHNFNTLCAELRSLL